MRIRYKKWARPELEASKFYIDNPEEYKGKWKTLYKNQEQPIYLELGCGKGQFIAKMASKHTENNYIAIDLVDAMLGLQKLIYILFIWSFSSKINGILSMSNLVIITFSGSFFASWYSFSIFLFANPWPKGKHHKKRLTHTRQLEKYKTFLSSDGEIFFKTDDDDLYLASLRYFEESEFEIISKTEDLHKNQIFPENIVTEHENMFTEQGITTKAIIAKLKSEK